MKIAIGGELSDSKFISKIDPLLENSHIKTVYLYRFKGNPYKFLHQGKIKHFDLKTRFKIIYTLCAFIHLVFVAVVKKPDLLVGIYFYPHGLLVSIISRLFKIKDVQVLPGSDLGQIKHSKLLFYFFRNSFRIGVRGNKSAEEVANLGLDKGRVFVLNNIFDLSQFVQASKTLVAEQKQCNLVFVGYFRREKCLDKIIEIVSELKKTKKNISCLMVGDGPEKENISALIKKYELSDNIFLIDYDANIAKWYKYGQIFILTSKVEGLNMSMIEAMSLGLPAIVPKINDLEEVVVDGVNGFLIRPDAALSEYIDKITILLESKEFYEEMSVNAQKSIAMLAENHYSEEAVSIVWQKILNDL